MRVITVTGEFIDTIPADPRTPGLFTGTGRTEFVKSLFSYADQYGGELRVAGQHWAAEPARPTVTRLANTKLSRGYVTPSERASRRAQRQGR